MNVLVACEYSGVVRESFRSLGHDAWSNDLLPADDNSPNHIQGDCTAAIRSRKWDLIIMHPPCTALAVSGNAWYGSGMPKHDQRLEAIRWTVDLWNLATSVCAKVCMENPVGVLPIKPAQYVQPWQFGHAESKKTGLWLRGLPELKSTQLLDKPACGHWDNQTPKRSEQTWSECGSLENQKYHLPRHRIRDGTTMEHEMIKKKFEIFLAEP